MYFDIWQVVEITCRNVEIISSQQNNFDRHPCDFTPVLIILCQNLHILLLTRWPGWEFDPPAYSGIIHSSKGNNSRLLWNRFFLIFCCVVSHRFGLIDNKTAWHYASASDEIGKIFPFLVWCIWNLFCLKVLFDFLKEVYYFRTISDFLKKSNLRWIKHPSPKVSRLRDIKKKSIN